MAYQEQVEALVRATGAETVGGALAQIQLYKASIARLKAVAIEQWEANHAEHCGPYHTCTYEDCGWKLPDELKET